MLLRNLRRHYQPFIVVKAGIIYLPSLGLELGIRVYYQPTYSLSGL